MSESLEYSKSVLIVEDEQSIRDVLVELFDVEGNVVSSAELLPEALERLRTQRKERCEFWFDIVQKRTP